MKRRLFGERNRRIYTKELTFVLVGVEINAKFAKYFIPKYLEMKTDIMKSVYPNAVFDIRKLRTLPNESEYSAEGNVQGRLYNQSDGISYRYDLPFWAHI